MILKINKLIIIPTQDILHIFDISSFFKTVNNFPLRIRHVKQHIKYNKCHHKKQEKIKRK